LLSDDGKLIANDELPDKALRRHMNHQGDCKVSRLTQPGSQYDLSPDTAHHIGHF